LEEKEILVGADTAMQSSARAREWAPEVVTESAAGSPSTCVHTWFEQQAERTPAQWQSCAAIGPGLIWF